MRPELTRDGLLVNAVHAAGGAGRVEVRASIDVHRRVARIDVADSGPGIPAEVLPRVFEPFFTTKATGTGLGLAVVRSIVESHGGEIAIQSASGAGTTASISLPLAPEAGEAKAAQDDRWAW